MGAALELVRALELVQKPPVPDERHAEAALLGQGTQPFQHHPVVRPARVFLYKVLRLVDHHEALWLQRLGDLVTHARHVARVGLRQRR
jgi:hypothetical protein